MFNLDKIDLPVLGYRGLEADLTEEEQAIQEMAHRFAEEVMRPIGEKLDRMTPEEVVAEAMRQSNVPFIAAGRNGPRTEEAMPGA